MLSSTTGCSILSVRCSNYQRSFQMRIFTSGIFYYSYISNQSVYRNVPSTRVSELSLFFRAVTNLNPINPFPPYHISSFHSLIILSIKILYFRNHSEYISLDYSIFNTVSAFQSYSSFSLSTIPTLIYHLRQFGTTVLKNAFI